MIQWRKMSLYQNRAVVADAIRLKQPQIFGHRREYAVDPGPPRLADPTRPYDAVSDLALLEPVLTIGLAQSANWQVTLENKNPRVAYKDVLYLATYRDASGNALEEHHEYFRDVFAPGERRTLFFNDGFVPSGYVNADIKVLAAEALLPRPGQELSTN
jgi:hypothetical protein